MKPNRFQSSLSLSLVESFELGAQGVDSGKTGRRLGLEILKVGKSGEEGGRSAGDFEHEVLFDRIQVGGKLILQSLSIGRVFEAGRGKGRFARPNGG